MDDPKTWIPQYGGWPAGFVAGVQGLRALVRRKRRGPAGTYVAIRRHDGDSDAPELILTVGPGMLLSPEGKDAATVIGEFGPNGALCLVLRGITLAPIYNPQVPWGDLRRLGGDT